LKAKKLVSHYFKQNALISVRIFEEKETEREHLLFLGDYQFVKKKNKDKFTYYYTNKVGCEVLNIS